MTTGNYYVYIMASRWKVLYVGVTNDLSRRVEEHRSRQIRGFTRKYHVTRLVHFEHLPTASAAIAREKTLKGWRRARKIALIEEFNPLWRDLFEELGAPPS